MKANDLYCLMAEYKEPEQLLAAAKQARAAGYQKLDAYSPFPVEGLAEAIGFRRNYVAPLVLAGGIIGGVSGYFMEWYANVVSYPINVGGRPLNSWPAFIPITFELTILIAALAGVVGMLMMNGLPKPYHPLFSVPQFDLATQDCFFLCIMATDPKFDLEPTRLFMEQLAPQEVIAVPFTEEARLALEVK